MNEGPSIPPRRPARPDWPIQQAQPHGLTQSLRHLGMHGVRRGPTDRPTLSPAPEVGQDAAVQVFRGLCAPGQGRAPDLPLPLPPLTLGVRVQGVLDLV
ncbi:hypothetical protein [Deinococcus marmoris]|uniref:hypothetical protein n=1 Tax=Deinococcus marmoris TaxID=249408 RepID=UPI00158E4F0D|nr:hypothetical protein [Deinococcus marmoris]